MTKKHTFNDIFFLPKIARVTAMQLFVWDYK